MGFADHHTVAPLHVITTPRSRITYTTSWDVTKPPTHPWARALDAAGLPRTFHVHDLRHTGNTFAAETGASLAELMRRMGHSSTKAARVYLHAREERDKEIAASLGKMAKRELKRSRKPGTTGGKVQSQSGT